MNTVRGHVRRKKTDVLRDELRQFVRRVGEDLSAVDKEIRHQELLGRSTGENQAHRRELAAHLAVLEKIGSSPSAFDYDSHVARARERADALFEEAWGEPSEFVARARADRWKKELKERGDFESFGRRLLAYRACPEVYTADRWHDLWETVLPNITKYVLAVDRDKIEVWLNLERRDQPLATFHQSEEETTGK